MTRFSPPRPGQALALIAPAGALEPAALEEALDLLERLWPEAPLRESPLLRQRAGYFSAGDAARAGDFTQAMLDHSVGAVWAARGGFGCSRLLPLLDLPALAASGRMLAGSSDLTALLNPLAIAGLVTVHAPVLIQLPRLDEPSRAELLALLQGRDIWPSQLRGQGLAAGVVTGPLMGGNLTTLCHLLGTPWFPDLTGAILFLEDLNEAAYRLDRLLSQLELAGVLGLVAGVAVGSLSDLAAGPPELGETVARRLAGLAKPVVMGLPFGHGAASRCLPLGALARLDGQAGILEAGL